MVLAHYATRTDHEPITVWKCLHCVSLKFKMEIRVNKHYKSLGWFHPEREAMVRMFVCLIGLIVVCLYHSIDHWWCSVAEAAQLHANVRQSIPECPPPLGGMCSDEISVVVIYDRQSVIISSPDTYSPFSLASVSRWLRPPNEPFQCTVNNR